MYSQRLRQNILERDLDGALPLLKEVTPQDLPRLMADLEMCALCDLFPDHILRAVAERIGVDAVEAYLCQNWAKLGEMLRSNITDTLTYIQLSDRAILMLAHHPANSTRIRHWIASGYYSQVISNAPQHKRRSPQILRELTQIIGHYTDEPTNERTLRQFLADANEAIAGGSS